MAAVTISRALISVSDKTGVVEFARFLAGRGVEILSTGGTAEALAKAGIQVTEVSAYTGFPEIMEGRVKTLHPKVHGGILAKRGREDHKKAMEEYGIGAIDLVVVNLYPFEETLKKGADFATCVENIDVGGPCMIRAAAKNHAYVAIVVEPEDYAAVMKEIETEGGVGEETRRKLAAKAFRRTAAYDAAISGWLGAEAGEKFPERITFTARRKQALRYGENPHQNAAFYVEENPAHGVATAEQSQGKELSYNNINDTDAAFALVSEFEQPAAVIVKHANPCGVGVGDSLVEAYKKAYATDPQSAFGGIVALNQVLDKATAEEIAKIFVEVIIASSAFADAAEVIAKKPNLRLLLVENMPKRQHGRLMVKSTSGGFLVQEEDSKQVTEADLKTVTRISPTPLQVQDMLFAFTVCKHVKSNAIVLARGGATIGVGAGQMSRVDSVRIAGWKAGRMNLSTRGSVLASDAFFPFPDNVLAAAEMGVTAIIQPGGSVKDQEVIQAADEKKIAMVFTGARHFRH